MEVVFVLHACSVNVPIIKFGFADYVYEYEAKATATKWMAGAIGLLVVLTLSVHPRVLAAGDPRSLRVRRCVLTKPRHGACTLT